MRRTPLQAMTASPVIVGALTTLVVVVAMFLSYNANNGLPFVAVYRVSVEAPNAARLVPGNEVRIGGSRVGVVESLEVAEADAPADPGVVPPTSARLNLKLDESVGALPRDSIFRVRYRSFFGLKYVEITRGTGPPAPEGTTFVGTDDEGICRLPVDPATFSETIPESARNGCFQEQTEGDALAAAFDDPTRRALRGTVVGLGDGLAARGPSLASAIAASAPLLSEIEPLARALSDPATRLDRFVVAAAGTFEALAGVSDELALGLRDLATTMDALSRDPMALGATISGAVPLLEQGNPIIRRARPLLARSAELLGRLHPGTRALPAAIPTLNEAILAGNPVLERTPRFARLTRAALRELRLTVARPETKITLSRTGEILRSARPLLAHVAPAQTVCNYFNYFTTFLGEHLSARSTLGFQQRNIFVTFPQDPPPVSIAGTAFDLDGEVNAPVSNYSGLPADGLAGPGPDPAENLLFKPDELPILHGPVNAPHGQLTPEYPDCASGQFGYPLGDLRIRGQGAWSPAVSDGDYPGSLGRTTLFFNAEGERQLRDTHVPSRQPTTWGLRR